MTTSKKPNRSPKKFVGLHSHSTMSIGDGIGLPQDHIDFAISNGADGLALTDHGNMNGFSHQFLHAQKLKEKGVNFKALPGIEAYFIPSLADWRQLYEARQQEKAKEKAEKELLKKKGPKSVEELANEHADLEEELAGLASGEADDDEEGGTVVENEEETKRNKPRDPLMRRSHLVLLAKNSAGLKALFRLVSDSYVDGFYRYPRMDFDNLKKYAQGNIVATSACLGGTAGKVVFENQEEPDWKLWVPNETNFEKIQKELTELGQRFQWALGEENFYWELQFNKINAQHLLNFHLIENSKRTGIPLVVTADAHYSNPDHWRERLIYKAMAQQQIWKQEFDASSLPKTIDELECELYPKNADQIWKSYLETGKAKFDFYDDSVDEIVCDAIERTWSIAHEQIENPEPDRRVKLPVLSKLVSSDELDKLKGNNENGSEEQLAFTALVDQAKAGAAFRKLSEKTNFDEYVARLKHELSVIKKLEFSKYFLTYAKIMEVVGKHQLIGAARGSAGGSLLSYVLGITQVDPIRFGLLFERFLTSKKKGFPDIDSDFSDRDGAVKLLIDYFGDENVVPVSNFAQLQVASLCKDLARLYDVPFDLVNKYTAQMRNEALAEAKKQPGFDAQVWDFTFEVANADSPSFRKFVEEMSKDHPKFKDALDVLFKQMRTISRHAGGVIITDDTRNNMPIIKAKGGLQTPWSEGLNFRHLENFGFLKFDILGLGTLRMFEDCIRRILKNKGRKYVQFKDIQKFFYENLHPDNNAMDDLNVYKTVYWNGKYAGIFQFIKENTQAFMREMKPRTIQDIAIATSLHRPGPLCLSRNTRILERISTYKKNGEPSRVFETKTIEQLFNEQESPVPHGRYKRTLVSFDETNKTLLANKISKIVKSGKKPVYSIRYQTRFDGPKNCKFSNSAEKLHKLEATLDHRFLTTDGWKPLRDLVEGDYIAVVNRFGGKKSRNDNRHITGYKNFRNTAFYNYKYECVMCDWNKGSLDVNHLNGGRSINNHAENLSYLCPNHHREFTEGSLSVEELCKHRETKRLFWNKDVRFVRFVGMDYVGEEETYDIEMNAPHHNFVAGGFIVHNSLGVDKLYLSYRKNPQEIVYKHPLLKEVFAETSGLLVFQEQLQMIYHKLAGVDLEDTDGVRKAFTKKDMSNKAAAEEHRQKLREEFAQGCKETNDIPERVSYSIFDEMEKLVAYSFNKSHAVAYAINSYQCAWFMTYYPDEWTSSYIDYCSTSKGKVAGQEDPKVVAQNEAKALGYEIGKPDINLSESETIIKDGVILPSFNTLKHIGTSVQREISRFRPYKNVKDLLWDSGGNWKHSKFNKRALSTLVKLEALDSMKLVGPGKVFPNYAAAHYVLIDKADELKRACSRKRNRNHEELLTQLIEEAQKIEPWSTQERIENQKVLVGSVDIDLILNPELKRKLRELAIKPINKRETKDDIVWGIVSSKEVKKTKTGKWFLKMKIYGEDAVQHMVFVWGYDPNRNKQDIQVYDIVIGQYGDSNFGLSAFYNKVKKLKT